jgi:CRP-like cAMP-binding protein
MVSPELLRRYQLFARLSIEHLNGIAMLAEEITFDSGETVFEAGQAAADFYLLMQGSLDLFYVSVDEINPELRKELFVSEVNPGVSGNRPHHLPVPRAQG